jgi:uncharacterized membrane protein YcaP (DUF421 family)
MELNIILRTSTSIIILFIAARLMGKRQISQLTFFDYIVGISIGSIAGQMSFDSKIPFRYGLISIATWSLFGIAFGVINVSSSKLRKLFEGSPSILVQNGKIIERNLKKEQVSINDLLEELRLKDVFNIEDVEFAILETNGQISVRLKSSKAPVTCSDLNIKTNYEGLCINLLVDGKIIKNHLELVSLDESWIYNELKKRNISSPKSILLATLDCSGNLHIDMKNSDPIEFKVLN